MLKDEPCKFVLSRECISRLDFNPPNDFLELDLASSFLYAVGAKPILFASMFISFLALKFEPVTIAFPPAFRLISPAFKFELITFWFIAIR